MVFLQEPWKVSCQRAKAIPSNTYTKRIMDIIVGESKLFFSSYVIEHKFFIRLSVL